MCTALANPGLPFNANGLLTPLLSPLVFRPPGDYLRVPLSLLRTKYQAAHVVQDLYTLGQVGSLYIIAYCVTHFVIMVAFALYVSVHYLIALCSNALIGANLRQFCG